MHAKDSHHVALKTLCFATAKNLRWPTPSPKCFGNMAVMELPDFPPKADLLTEIYQPLPNLTAVIDWDALDVAATAEGVVTGFSTVLESTDKNALGNVFLAHQAYWRDTLAVTSHMRTFKDREVIAAILIELKNKRLIHSISIVPASAQIGAASNTLVSLPDPVPLDCTLVELDLV